jgi:hypothetical protein
MELATSTPFLGFQHVILVETYKYHFFTQTQVRQFASRQQKVVSPSLALIFISQITNKGLSVDTMSSPKHESPPLALSNKPKSFLTLPRELPQEILYQSFGDSDITTPYVENIVR